MSDASSIAIASAELIRARRYKAMFDNTWILATVLAASQVLLCWYLRLGQIAIGPIIWTLAALNVLQMLLAARGSRASTPHELRRLAFASQLLGSALLAVSWHLDGGLQQPLFPLLAVLPLLPGALLFGFWQQQVALLVLLIVLVSGVLLSPDSYALFEEHYGVGAAAAYALPGWWPHSSLAFTEVATSTSYDLSLTGAVACIAIAVSTTARALVSLFHQESARLLHLEDELQRQQGFIRRLVTRSPVCEVLLEPQTGRILEASERFGRHFSLQVCAGVFLLDAVQFRYPDVVQRLLRTGGEELQIALIDGRERVLRLTAEPVGPTDSPLTALCLEPYAELCWRGELDAVDEPMFAIDAAGLIGYPNRAARALLGAEADGGAAHTHFQTSVPRWWDIAPLDSARRLIGREGREFLALIRRERVTESLGELAFVRLQEKGAAQTGAEPS